MIHYLLIRLIDSGFFNIFETTYALDVYKRQLVEIAEKEEAFYIAHGCTGKGNDQVRFETTIKALNPAIKIIAPWRFWDFSSREDLIEYAKAHNIPISQTTKKIYSRDENIWHISHEGGELENPWNEHLKTIHVLSVAPEDAPDEPTYVDIDFEDVYKRQGLLTVPPPRNAPLRYAFLQHFVLIRPS